MCVYLSSLLLTICVISCYNWLFDSSMSHWREMFQCNGSLHFLGIFNVIYIWQPNQATALFIK